MSIEQKPVAWIVVNKETGYKTQVAYLIPLYEKEMFEVIPLYTAPPKREPLSDAEITKLWANQAPQNEFACVRLIEKAHGIGVDDEN